MRPPPEADRQDGVFTWRQARAAGVSPYLVNKRERDGYWRRVLGDAFVVAGTPLTSVVRDRAASLVTGGVLSHASAARLHGLDLGIRLDPGPHVITRRRVHVNVAGVTEHRMLLGSDEVEPVRGMAVTTTRRTVVDLLAHLPEPSARTMLFRCVQQGLLDRATLDADIARRHGWHGNTRLRRFSRMLGTGAHSVAEHLLHEKLGDTSVRWRANVELRLLRRVVEVDVLVGDRLVVEVDGWRHHTALDRFVDDRRRQNDLVEAGYTVLRYTWADLMDRPEAAVAEIVAMAARVA